MKFMSRKGKKPITIPQNVEVKIEKNQIIVKGPKGELIQKIHPHVNIEKLDQQILITVKNPEEVEDRTLWGLYGSLVKNMIEGVTSGFEKRLEIVGIGYKATQEGNKLIFRVGFAEPVEIELPKGITGTVDKNIIIISGIDKQLVGDVAARIRAIRPPEPYKGKGIKYLDEIIKKKAGKAAKSAGAKAA